MAINKYYVFETITRRHVYSTCMLFIFMITSNLQNKIYIGPTLVTCRYLPYGNRNEINFHQKEAKQMMMKNMK